jgi:hypothetical protein
MSEQDRRLDQERRLRRAALIAATQQVPEPEEAPRADTGQGDTARPGDDTSSAPRPDQTALWVDVQVRAAIDRGDFDDLPGAGKPLRGLNGTHDPDWWVKGLIEREKITGVLPPALALRKEDAELQAALDREATEAGVRRYVEDFNRRVVEARRQLLGGPPVVTPTRDADAEVAAWAARREERRARQRERLAGKGSRTGSAEGRGRRWPGGAFRWRGPGWRRRDR